MVYEISFFKFVEANVECQSESIVFLGSSSRETIQFYPLSFFRAFFFQPVFQKSLLPIVSSGSLLLTNKILIEEEIEGVVWPL